MAFHIDDTLAFVLGVILLLESIAFTIFNHFGNTKRSTSQPRMSKKFFAILFLMGLASLIRGAVPALRDIGDLIGIAAGVIAVFALVEIIKNRKKHTQIITH